MAEENSFLGKGWAFPPGFSKNGEEVEMVTNDEDIRQSISILISTSIGERLMHPDFGCDLGVFMFENIDQGMITRMREMISNALLYHEPRIQFDEIDIVQDVVTPGLLKISIDYTVRATNSRHNIVYPFHLQEASAGE